jgi:hypothetical protein
MQMTHLRAAQIVEDSIANRMYAMPTQELANHHNAARLAARDVVTQLMRLPVVCRTFHDKGDDICMCYHKTLDVKGFKITTERRIA